MGTKKNNKQDESTNVMKQLLPLVTAGIIGVIAATGCLYVYQIKQLQPEQQHTQAQLLARSLANQVHSTIEISRKQLDILSNRRDANRALADNDLSSFNMHQQQWFPEASVQLISHRDSDMSRLSYTAQELLKKASLGQKPEPVIIAGDIPRLVIARATHNEFGSLLLTQSLVPLATALRASIPNGGALAVKYAGTPLLNNKQRASGGTAQVTQGPVEVSLALRAHSDNSLIVAILGVSLGAVAILLTTLLVNRLLNRALRQDVAELIRYSDELIHQPGVTARDHFHFPVLKGANEASARLAQKLRERAGATRPHAAAQTDALLVEENDDDSILLIDDDDGDQAVPDSIFRAYDIRGIAGDTLTAQGTYLLGRAIGSEAGELGQQTVLVARDGRLSSPELSRSLIKGLLESGRDVVNLGLVPTPVLYYATEVLETQTGIMLTGSHNPPQHNGLKTVMNGDTLYGERILALSQRIKNNAFSEGRGHEEERDITDRYLNDIASDIVLARPLKIAIDCGNGATGELAPRLFSQLGCEVAPLYTEIDGNFPNHAPDTGNPDNLTDLIRVVQEQELDLGLAFDGDGDRVAVVTNTGEIIWPDRLLMLFAKDLLARSPGADILFDVKCSRALPAIIRKNGGRPLMYKTGHSLIKAKMKESGTALAGEISGHIFFADRWFGCDDGAYAGARLLEILSLQDDTAGQVFDQFQTGATTPALYIDATDDNKFALIDALKAHADQFTGGRPTTIDGLRVDFPDGWGLVRASNTTPSLVARFEGRDEEALERVKEQFRKQLHAIDKSLKLPF